MQGQNSVDCCHNDCIVLSRIVEKQESGVHVCVDISSYACSYVSKQMGMLMCYVLM